MRRLALLLSLALVGCNGSGDDSGPLQPPPAGQGIQYSMQSTLDPGQEIERCKLFVVPPDGLNIYKEQIRYSAGSHHILLYATGYAGFPATNKKGLPIQPETVYDCPDGAPADYDVTSVLGGAQSANAPPVIDLPDDTAVSVVGGTVVVLNTHYLNATPKTVDTDARINVWTIPSEKVAQHAGMIFFYDPIIRVPAMSSATARMACPVNHQYKIYNLQTHMHRRGLGGSANLTDADGNVLQALYTSDSWENVPVKKFDSLDVMPGQLIDYRCNYQSNEDHTVLQGLTTHDEMCMLIGAYAPHNSAFEFCSPDGGSQNKGFAATFIGSGASSCMDSISCLESAQQLQKGTAQDDAIYGCVLNACEHVAKPFNQAVRCEITEFDGSCKTACNGTMSSTCVSCLRSACSTEIGDCASSACN
jgi:hypothetical protein